MDDHVVVRFEDVSKRYRLSSGQSSLRESLSALPRRLLGRVGGPGARAQEIWALRDVGFELRRGEALGLIGPNGAGKTTALKLLAGVTRPTSGRIEIRGKLSALIELGAGFHPDLTGRENVYLNAAILGLPRKRVDRLFDQIVAFSGLERFIDTPVKRYSSGMYVRLGFSVAAYVGPDVLLVDEVLAVGDSQFRQRCGQRINELRDMGTTIVFVSHNLHLVKSICDKAIFLGDGHIRSQGDVVDVINAYETWSFEAQSRNSSQHALEITGLPSSSIVDIEQVEIQSLNGADADKLGHADAVEVRVHFRAKEPIRKPNLVLRFTRADGATCCMIRTADYGYALEDLEGRGLISLAIDPLQLADGAYFAKALIVGELDGIPLAQGYSRWFRVSGLSLGHGQIGGVFVPRVAWARVKQTSPSQLCADNVLQSDRSERGT